MAGRATTKGRDGLGKGTVGSLPDETAGPTGIPRRAPTLAAFAALGLFWGAWAAVLPSVQRATNASKGSLGLALLFVTLAAIPAMLFVAGPLVERFGTRAMAISAVAFAAATTLPGLANSIPALILALALTGATTGTLDVAMNASAARIEQASGKKTMPLAHGLYSVGVLVGAVAAGLARSAGSGRESILLAISFTVALVGLWTARYPMPLKAPESHGLRFARALILIGLVGAAAFVIEGGVETWSALYLERQLGAHPAVSGLGPGFFGAAMAAGRFWGQTTRRNDRSLLIGGALVAAVGCVLIAVAQSPPLALAGIVLGGLGVALNAPIVFGAGGRRSPTELATVTTLGYAGLLVGPPLVGGVAQASSLRASFVVLACLAAAVAAAARRVQLN